MAERIKSGKLPRVIYLCIGMVYLSAVIWVTAYAQTGYRDSLPSVKLGVVVDGEIPMTALEHEEASGQYTLYTVERQDGPWGYDYRLQAVKLVNFMPIDEDTWTCQEKCSRKTYKVIAVGNRTA